MSRMTGEFSPIKSTCVGCHIRNIPPNYVSVCMVTQAVAKSDQFPGAVNNMVAIDVGDQALALASRHSSSKVMSAWLSHTEIFFELADIPLQNDARVCLKLGPLGKG